MSWRVEMSHPATNPVDIEIGLNFDDSGDVGDILRTPRQCLHDDEILGSSHADLEASRIDHSGPLDHFLLEGQGTQRQVDIHTGSMSHQKNTRAPRELQSVRNAWLEPILLPRCDQRFRICIENDGVNVLREPWLSLQAGGNAPNHRCLESFRRDPPHQVGEGLAKVIVLCGHSALGQRARNRCHSSITARSPAARRDMSNSLAETISRLI